MSTHGEVLGRLGVGICRVRREFIEINTGDGIFGLAG